MNPLGRIPRETDLPGYQTPGSHGTNFSTKSPGVAYPREIDSPGYQTPASQSPQGMWPRWVNLPGVCDPGESLMTPGSQQPFLYLFA